MPIPIPTTGQQIDLDYARQLVKNFRDDKRAAGKIRTDDTQSVWFSKDIILRALGMVDNDASANAGVTGLRFYFGSYTTEAGYPQNEFNQNKLTLVMVQTGTASMEISRNGVPETAFLDVINEPVPGAKTQPSYPKGPTTGANPLFNDGQMAPPPPPPGAISDLGLLDW